MIWVTIFSALFIFIFILSKCIFGTIKTPISVFCLLWCLIGIGSNAAFYDYYEPSLIVNITIFIACIESFAIYAFLLQGLSKSFFINEIKIDSNYLKINRILTINIFCVLLLAPYVAKSIKILIFEGFASLRTQEMIESGLIATITDSFIRPLFTATTILSIVYSFSNGKRKEKILLIFLSIVINVEQVILSAGRAPFVNLVFYLMIAIILFYGRSLSNILHKGRKYVFFGIFAIIAILLITKQRNMSSSENLLLYNTYVYYFSGPSYLTQLIKNVKSYGPNGTLLYGTASFGFVTNVISDIMIFISGKAQGSLYLLGSVISNNQYWVGSHTLINAMYTCFYPFIIDYGWAGIFICPIFIAISSVIITKRLYKTKDILNITLYIYWTYVIIRTVFKWDLVNIDLTVVLVSLCFFTKRKLLK